MLGYVESNEPVLRVYTSNQGRRYVPVSELLSMQADANYTWLRLKSGERILVPRTLKYLEGCLPSGRFLRLRRQFSVNIDVIGRVVVGRYNQMTVLLQTGEQVAVARRRIVALREQLLMHPNFAN